MKKPKYLFWYNGNGTIEKWKTRWNNVQFEEVNKFGKLWKQLSGWSESSFDYGYDTRAAAKRAAIDSIKNRIKFDRMALKKLGA